MDKKDMYTMLQEYPAALKVVEVAEILRTSTKTVYKLINECKIPAIRVGRENRVAKIHLINYMVEVNKSQN